MSTKAEDKVPIVEDSSPKKTKDVALYVEKAENVKEKKKASGCVDFWCDVIGLLCIAAVMFLFAYNSYRADQKINSLNARINNSVVIFLEYTRKTF